MNNNPFYSSRLKDALEKIVKEEHNDTNCEWYTLNYSKEYGSSTYCDGWFPRLNKITFDTDNKDVKTSHGKSLKSRLKASFKRKK